MYTYHGLPSRDTIATIWKYIKLNFKYDTERVAAHNDTITRNGSKKKYTTFILNQPTPQKLKLYTTL
jgi:hypothetical protein